jgi:ABC-type oligopeptide transport system substrate-binding subunit
MKRNLAVLFVWLMMWAGSIEAAERIFHRVGTDDPATLDPHKVALPGEQLVILDMFMSLSTPGMNGRPIPGAAESWTISADGKTYLFKLRPNSRWSDGKPLTAADWVWSFQRMLDPATAFPLASRLFPIRNARAVATGVKPPTELGVSAPDARTVRIDLENPAPYLVDSMMAAAMPVPRHVIEKYGAAWVRPENFVSNGPFVLEEWRPNAYVRLRRNANFWAADRVTLDGVYHYPISDPATLLRRFNAGELDFVMVVPPDRAADLQSSRDPRLKVMRGLANEVIVFNTRRGPAADARVRRALSMLIEREAIARAVIGFPGVEGYSFVPPGVLNYGNAATPDFAAWLPGKRVAEAQRLLAAAGYTNDKPLRMRLGFPNTDLNRKVAVTIGAMWSRGGVKVDLESKESKALFAEIGKGDFDAVRTVWVASASDPYAYLERMVSTGSAGAVNTSGYANPKFDERLEAASREVDVQRRAAILREAESIALADQPVAPVYYLVGRRLVAARVQGFADNPRGVYPTWMMSVAPR